MASPRPIRHFAAYAVAVALWIALAHLAGGDALDPRTSAWYAPAALSLVLGMAWGPRAAIVPIAGGLIGLSLDPHTIAPVASVELIVTGAHALCYTAAGVYLTRRRIVLRDAGMRDLLHLLSAGALVAPMTVGLVHTLAVRSVGLAPARSGFDVLIGWASRDAAAILIGASLPAALSAAWHQRRPIRRIAILSDPRADRLLACLQGALLAASIAIAFVTGDPQSHPLYIAVPGLLWLAASRGHRFAALGVALFGVGLWYSHTYEPRADPTALRLQVMATAVLTLAVGAQVDDRRRAAATFNRMNLALQLSEARYRSVIENAADGFLVIDDQGEIEIANAAVERLFGYAAHQIEGMHISVLIPRRDDTEADYLPHLLETGAAAASGETHWIGRRLDGSTFPLRVALSRVDVAGRAAYTAIIQDESERRQFEEQLEHQATHDALTDLPNRALFHDRLLTELERLRRHPGSLALILLDLDRFKEINDTLGHAVGDLVLTESAHRLRDTVRRSDTVARLGGDEFAILLGPSAGTSAAAAIAERALAALRRPFPGLPVELSPTASIGIRMIARPDDDPAELLRHADSAMYQAKRAGKDCFRFYSSPELTLAPSSEIDLRDRIDDGAVTLRYQPVIDSASGRVVSIEALARLTLPDNGLMEPREFIPLAERSGLIDRLGEQVLRRGLMDLYALRRDVHEDLSVSVNVSPRQLSNRHFPELVADALQTSGLTPDALILELTESTDLADVVGAPDVLRAIARTGVRIAIDDFGTGHTRFAMLRDLPIAILKIDRSFVAGIDEPGPDRDIVEAIITLAQRRGIVPVAEGVETIELVDQLTLLGCTMIQGFLFGKPIAIGELTKLLVRWKAVPAIATRLR